MEKEKTIVSEQLEANLTFLEKTKNGEYAEIGAESLEYIRLEILRDDYTLDGEFLFGIS